MFTDNSVPNSQAVVRNLTYRFMIRLNESNHLFVRAMISSDMLYTSREYATLDEVTVYSL